jgi:hypothetical protein
MNSDGPEIPVPLPPKNSRRCLFFARDTNRSPPPKLFFAKTLSKIACQAPKPPNTMTQKEITRDRFPSQSAILK